MNPEFRDLVIFQYLSFYFYHHSRMQNNSLHSIFQQNKIKCNSSIPTTIGIIVNLSEKNLFPTPLPFMQRYIAIVH